MLTDTQNQLTDMEHEEIDTHVYTIRGEFQRNVAEFIYA